jgi:hypothetical protein
MNQYMNTELLELIKSNRDLYENEPNLFFESVIEPALRYNNIQNKALHLKIESLEQRIKFIEGILKEKDWGYKIKSNNKDTLSSEIIDAISKADKLRKTGLNSINQSDGFRHNEFDKKQEAIKELLDKTGAGLGIRYSKLNRSKFN